MPNRHFRGETCLTSSRASRGILCVGLARTSKGKCVTVRFVVQLFRGRAPAAVPPGLWVACGADGGFERRDHLSSGVSTPSTEDRTVTKRPIIGSSGGAAHNRGPSPAGKRPSHRTTTVGDGGAYSSRNASNARYRASQSVSSATTAEARGSALSSSSSNVWRMA
jgi:hypothetical protein